MSVKLIFSITTFDCPLMDIGPEGSLSPGGGVGSSVGGGVGSAGGVGSVGGVSGGVFKS